MPRIFSTYTDQEDHALFLLIKKKDKQAFTVIYQKYHTYLYSLALRYLKNKELAEDTVQHVFVKLWDKSEDIKIEINLKNFLYTMTKNHILNLFRDNKEHISLSYADAQREVEGENDFFKLIDEVQMSDILRAGIEKLPPQKRDVCKLKLEGDISNQEIADRMGISVHTVKSHYQESIKMLRTYFKKNKTNVILK